MAFFRSKLLPKRKRKPSTAELTVQPRVYGPSGTVSPGTSIDFLVSQNLFLGHRADVAFTTADLAEIRADAVSATVSDGHDSDVMAALELVANHVRTLFGDGARVCLVRNNDLHPDSPVFLIEARYGIEGDVGDEVWERHDELLRRFVRDVPTNVRRQVALTRHID